MEIVIHTKSIDSKIIQQVSKASSDQLLSKFADFDSDNEASPSPADASKRHRSFRILKKKRVVNNNSNSNSNSINTSNYYGNNVEEYGGSNFNNGSLKVVERKSLLPQQKTKRSSSRGGLLFKHLGISKSNYVRGGKEFKKKALFCAIDKTWSKAIRGASKVFMEKHYNRHRILIDDIV